MTEEKIERLIGDLRSHYRICGEFVNAEIEVEILADVDKLRALALSALRPAEPIPWLLAAQKMLQAASMEDHNDNILKGKWKKGAKAWNGEYVKRLRTEAIAELTTLVAEHQPTPPDLGR